MASVTRIALVSDVHGNLHALERVLEDARAASVDGVACLGDVCTLGPYPVEVLSLLRERASWFIQGNHDEYMSKPELLAAHSTAPVVTSAVAWCRSELDPSSHAFLQTFTTGETIELGAGVRLALYHGSPGDNTQDVLAETPPAELDELLRGHGADVLAGGHTHVQMLRQHRGKLVVNPGSVGLPFRECVTAGAPTVLPHAEYAIIEARQGNVSVGLRRVELELVAQSEKWSEPMGRYLTQQYRQ